MNVLISGSSGFVGKNLIPYLKLNGINTFTLEIRQDGWAKHINTNVDALIHLAGKAHDLKKTGNEAAYYKVNTELTKEVFTYFLKSHAKDFIFLSSVKAAADTVSSCLSEDVVPNPKSVYGKSKLLAEQYLLAQQLPPNKRLFILRPCMIHGPGNKGNLNLLYQLVVRRIPYPLASFHNNRSFLSIDNLNYIICCILTKNTVASGIYHVADDEVISTNDIVKIMGMSLGKKAKLWPIPKGIISWLAIVGDLFGLPLNSDRLKKLTESYKVSNSKIKSALAIQKLPFSAQEGLSKTFDSFKNGTEN